MLLFVLMAQLSVVFLAPPFLIMPSSYHRTTSLAKRKVACAVVFHSFFFICFTHCLPARFFFSLSYLLLLLQIVPCFSFFFKDCFSTHFMECYLTLFFFYSVLRNRPKMSLRRTFIIVIILSRRMWFDSTSATT